MKTFLVGGAVRDGILGRSPKDQDFVIVGATADDIEKMFADGFTQVGADFPVFLHPRTGNEYALARVERKTGNGYGGFTVETENVTLEEDLSRRDLTINAMAQDVETGEIIDPFGGQHDLAQGVLRHTTEAFAEDPLRVLRVARFAARYSFSIADATQQLMMDIVDAGELDHLSRERIWVELEKILNERNSAAGITVLEKVGALKSIFKQNMLPRVLAIIKKNDAFDKLNTHSKFIVLTSNIVLSRDDMQSLKVPSDFQKARTLFLNVVDRFNMFDDLNAVQKVEFFTDIGAFNNFKAFTDILDAFDWFKPSWTTAVSIMAQAKVARDVDSAFIAANTVGDGKSVGAAIKTARALAISKWSNN